MWPFTAVTEHQNGDFGLNLPHSAPNKNWPGYWKEGSLRETHNYAKDVEQMWGVRWACTHLVTNVYILTKIWDQKRGDWDMPAGHTWEHICMQLCKGGSQVDMHTCTDACTYSKFPFIFEKRHYLLLITSSNHLSTRWNVNLLECSISKFWCSDC